MEENNNEAPASNESITENHETEELHPEWGDLVRNASEEEVVEEQEAPEVEADAEEVSTEENKEEEKSEDDQLPELTDEQIAKILKARKHIVKVDGEEREIDYDQLLADYQLRQASNKRFEEAARIRKEAEEVLEILKNSPDKALKKLGQDPYELAEKLLAEKLEEEMLSPEERRIRQVKRELEELEAKKAEIERQESEAKKEAEQKEYVERLAKEYEETVPKVFSEKGIPVNNYTWDRLEQYISYYEDQGVELPIEQAATFVADDFRKELNALVTTLPQNQLAQLLDNEALMKLRGVETQKLKSPKAPPKKVEADAPAQEEMDAADKDADILNSFDVPKVDGKMSIDDYFDNLRKKFNAG